MTEPTPAKEITAKAAKATPRKAPAKAATPRKVAPVKPRDLDESDVIADGRRIEDAAKKTTAKKATTKPEFAPKVTANGRLDHSECSHPRTLAGRSACRAAFRTAQKAAQK